MLLLFFGIHASTNESGAPGQFIELGKAGSLELASKEVSQARPDLSKGSTTTLSNVAYVASQDGGTEIVETGPPIEYASLLEWVNSKRLSNNSKPC